MQQAMENVMQMLMREQVTGLHRCRHRSKHHAQMTKQPLTKQRGSMMVGLVKGKNISAYADGGPRYWVCPR